MQASSPSKPVLLFVVNVAWYFRLHRMHVARAALEAGYEVHVATAPDTPLDVTEIVRQGLTHHPIQLRRGHWSFIEEVRLVCALYRLNRTLRPTIVHNVTIKPVICGTLAARFAGAPAIINAMSGLGFIFTASGLVANVRRLLVSALYGVLFASSRVRVIFENNDDLESFARWRLVRRDRSFLIRGAGVDLTRFRVMRKEQIVPLVILPARMLYDKGVREFCEAAVALRSEGVRATFALVGGLDPHNPAAISAEWLHDQQATGAVEWLGQCEDMPSIYTQASIVCLPSYREGLPTVLLEGAACGCALIATDVPGCREVVQDDETGLLVPARNTFALVAALRRMLGDPDLRTRLAVAAREHVKKEFSAERVRAETMQAYRQIISARQVTPT